MQVFTSLYIHVCTKQNKMFWKEDFQDMFWGRVGQYFVEICRFAICELVMRICWFSIAEWAHEFADLRTLKNDFFWPLLTSWDLVTLTNNWIRFWDNWLLKQKKSPNLHWRQMLIILLHIKLICLQKSLCNPALLPSFL